MTNKTALITGASRGLGLALATELAKKGWHLLINGRGEAALTAAQAQLARDTSVIAVAGDVTDPLHQAALAAAAADMGGLDLVVNNAGTLGSSPLPALLDYSQAALLDVFRVNVVGALGILQALRGQLRSDAVIVNITSDAAREAYAGWGGYGASKAALEQISRVFSAENPQWHVYEVDPGDMRTQMHQDAFPGEDIGDRPPASAAVPGLLRLIEGTGGTDGSLPNGRYQAQALTLPA